MYHDSQKSRQFRQPNFAATTKNRAKQESQPHISLVIQRKGNCSCGGSCPACQTDLPIQAKLSVSHPNDRYEIEADRVAAQVMQSALINPDIASIVQSPQLNRITAVESPTEDDAMVVQSDELGSLDDETEQVQRLSEGIDEEEENPEIQRLKLVGPDKKSKQAKQEAFERRLQGSLGQGELLAPEHRRLMESRFKRDFSGVRIHDDSQAKQMSSDVNARAFTYGRHIYFNQGEYKPDSNGGKKVLAHELTHVVQQGAATARGANADASPTPAISNRNQGQSDRQSVDRMSSLGQGDTPTVTDVRPWNNTLHPVGNDYQVQTDAGSAVSAWVAYSPYRNNLRYWCHGFSLNTYPNSPWGYSVYSGSPMRTVVKDEWRAIPPGSAKAGDIAVWSNYQHSAKFTSVAKKPTGGIDEAASRLDSKNGRIALNNYSMSQLIAIKPYGPSYGIYRHR